MPKMNSGDATQEPVLVDDFYPGFLKEVTEYQKDYGDGPVDKLAWVFEVTADESALDEDVEPEEPFTGTVDVAAHTSLATGPRSNFAKLNLPAFAGADWDRDTDSLIGRDCEVYVESYETKGGQTRNVVTKVKVSKKTAKARKQKAEAELAETEKEFENIPT
jgi:hypothetical protein